MQVPDVVDHGAVWTGTQMIVWGQSWPAGAGGIFDPAANGWTRWLRTDGGPETRTAPSVVWAGSRMIVWGGIPYVGSFDTTSSGAAYDPGTDSWMATAVAGAPEARWFHSAVSTGSTMIIWGGQPLRGAYLRTGGIYDPAANTWTATSTNGAPSPRTVHSAVWTGTRMIVWGGVTEPMDSTGGVFDPATNTWRATATNGAPSPRWDHVAVWTGSRMVVWGGLDAQRTALDSGGVYDPATDVWTPLSRLGAPSPRMSATAVWTGTRMIVWGGASALEGAALGDGGIYDPARDSWTAVASGGAPAPRLEHTAVWTGSKMVVWGGRNAAGSSFTPLNTGGIYDDPTVIP